MNALRGVKLDYTDTLKKAASISRRGRKVAAHKASKPEADEKAKGMSPALQRRTAHAHIDKWRKYGDKARQHATSAASSFLNLSGFGVGGRKAEEDRITGRSAYRNTSRQPFAPVITDVLAPPQAFVTAAKWKPIRQPLAPALTGTR